MFSIEAQAFKPYGFADVHSPGSERGAPQSGVHVADSFSDFSPNFAQNADLLQDFSPSEMWQGGPSPRCLAGSPPPRTLSQAAHSFLLTDGAPAGRIAQLTGKPFFFLLDTAQVKAMSVQDIFGEVRAANLAVTSERVTQPSLAPLVAVYVYGDFSRIHELGDLPSLFACPSRQLLTMCLLTSPIAADSQINAGLDLFRAAVASTCFAVGTLVERHLGVSSALSFRGEAVRQPSAFALAAVVFATFRNEAGLDFCLAHAPNPFDVPLMPSVNVVDVLAQQGDVARLERIFGHVSDQGDVAALFALSTNASLQPYNALASRAQSRLHEVIGI